MRDLLFSTIDILVIETNYIHCSYKRVCNKKIEPSSSLYYIILAFGTVKETEMERHLILFPVKSRLLSLGNHPIAKL